MAQWRTPSWQMFRDPVIVITCLILTVYEAVFAKTFHPELLIFFSGLIATPYVLQRDRNRNQRRQNGDSDSSDGSSSP